MGYEYLIVAETSNDESWADLFQRLENPLGQNGWHAFKVEMTDRGIYFCDNGRSAAAAIAFRRIIDQALVSAESVTVTEVA